MSEQIPTKCPECGAKLVQTDIRLDCPNRKKQHGKACHFGGVWL